MIKRELGRSGITIPPLVLGANVFGWTADRLRSFELLDRYAGAGFQAIDTADMYSTWAPGNKGGESETIIGEWLKTRGKRGQMVVITKVGLEMPDGKGLSATWIQTEVENSLRRLQTDHIDVYFSHTYDSEAPLEETLGAYDRLIKAGKVRTIGASNHSAHQVAAALKVSSEMGLPRYEILEPRYNLYDRATYDGALRDLALREGLGVTPYYGLARGFLTGKYRSEADLGKSTRGKGVREYLNERGLRILAALDDIAAAHQAAPGEIAIAWLIARKGVTAPIASVTSLDQMENLIRATELRLSAGDMEQLEHASAE